MFCPNCGTQNPETASTCSKCGFAMKSATPKFKGTMLMQNSPPVPGAPGAPRPGSSPNASPGAGGASPPPSGEPSFKAEARPIGAGPGAGATGAAPKGPSQLKGTIVGVAPPSAGGAPGGAGGAPAQGFGGPPDALGATMAVDNQSPFAPGNAPPGGGADFGAPPPQQHGAYGAPPAPAAGFGGAAPAPQGDAFGGAPQGGPPPQHGGYGAPAGGYGQQPGQPGQQPPYGGQPQQDFGAQMNQGFNQVGQAMGQAADQFGQAFNQGGGYGAQQPYGGPMMGPQGSHPMMGGPGAKSFMTTLLLALFAGWAGVHRFYTGHTMIGVIQLLTCGGMGFWSLLDIIFIVTGKYTDAQGRPLQK